jgi:hypothetical protein
MTKKIEDLMNVIKLLDKDNVMIHIRLAHIYNTLRTKEADWLER